MMCRVSKATLAMGLLAVMAGAWYWALRPWTPSTSQPLPVARLASSAAGDVMPAVRLRRLSSHSASVPPSARDSRDPFKRGIAHAAPEQPRRAERTVAAPAPTSAPTPAWPRVELIGIAETREATGLVRIAIVSGPAGVYHVRPGDLVEDVYRIERIATDGVDVRLLPEDRALRLMLQP